jgi:hypothetical protein
MLATNKPLTDLGQEFQELDYGYPVVQIAVETKIQVVGDKYMTIVATGEL